MEPMAQFNKRRKGRERERERGGGGVVTLYIDHTTFFGLDGVI